ncbi:MAG: hypothetical protein ACFBZ9_10380 [Sphingomonadales bacterium]
MLNSHSLALKVSAVLWVIWGLVHLLAGIVTMSVDTTSAFQGIAAAVEPSLLVADYHPAVGAILNQHGWNLAWAGAVTIVGAVFIWRKSGTSIWVTGLVGGLFDIGYFVFVDLGGFGTFFPGTSMTFVSASAIVLSFWVGLTALRPQQAGPV